MIAPQHLTFEEVAAACRAAYANGTLLAVAAERGAIEPDCVYKNGEYRCAIGVALNDRTLNAITDKGMLHNRINALVRDGIIFTEDLIGLDRLQRLHDAWFTGERGKADFLRFIGQPTTVVEDGQRS